MSILISYPLPKADLIAWLDAWILLLPTLGPTAGKDAARLARSGWGKWWTGLVGQPGKGVWTACMQKVTGRRRHWNLLGGAGAARAALGLRERH